MTQSKRKRLQQQLIEAYGDFAVVELVDAYFPMKRDVDSTADISEENIIRCIRMSETEIESHEDYKVLERIGKGLNRPFRRSVRTPESEELYNSENYREARARKNAECEHIAAQARSLFTVSR